MKSKIFLGTSVGLIALFTVNETAYLKLDRNLLRPIRDYRSFLNDYNRI